MGIQLITYPVLLMLFLVGSVLGVLLEGIFCLVRYGRWETHTVTLWGDFCIIYGLGAVGFYVGAILMNGTHVAYQFIAFAIIATIIEYLCGALLKYALGMKAWDYSKDSFSFQGLICAKMSFVWGLAGVLFAKYAVPLLVPLVAIFEGSLWQALSAIVTVLMALNLLITCICIIRWADRHKGLPPKNSISVFIDKEYNDNLMSQRFCEWRFIDAGQASHNDEKYIQSTEGVSNY